MIDSETVLAEVRRALRGEPRVDFDRQAIRLAFTNGEVLVSGEVDDIAAKRLAVERVATTPSVASVVDELCVRAATSMTDSEIRDLVRTALAEEPVLAGCTIREPVSGGFTTVRSPSTEVGRIDIKAQRGVVILEGDVSSLAQRRLAGVLSWWVPGTRNVINDLAVRPSEDDSDELIADAVRVVLEKDALVHAGGIRVAARHAVVILDGVVPAAAERAAAERDAWYVAGVADVVNQLEVRV